MIGLPFNDRRCLGSITEVVAELVANRDDVLVQLAAEHPTTAAVAAWIRTLPQRDDVGEAGDGPKVDACEPPQRLRLPAPDPNCVERAALYLALGELIDPAPMRQLATLDTPIGLHTFPVEDGRPIILDPRVPRNALACGLAMERPGPVAIAPHDAIEWTAQLAEAAAAPYRNGPDRVRRGRNAIRALVDDGAPPAADDVDAMAWLLGLAERVARRYGARAMAMVRSTAQAIADLAADALARAQRNLALEIGGLRLEPAPWMAGLARVAARVGVDLGAMALRSKLESLGIGDDVFGVVEGELEHEAMTLGPLRRPARLSTLATIGDRHAA